jgi:murein DD-endopeptidase MepM/ murein hydrolase activator NlpD
VHGKPHAAHLVRPARRAVTALVAAAVLAPLMLALPVGMPAQADSVTDRKKALAGQLDELRDSLEGTNQDLIDAAVKLKLAKSDLDDARDSLDAARDQLAQAQRQDQIIAAKLSLAQAAEQKAQRDLDGRLAMEATTRNRIGSIARETYVSSGMSGLSIALNAQSPEQFADRINAAGTALRGQNGAVERLRVQQAETRARQQKLEAVRAQVAGLKRESEALVAQRAGAEQQAIEAEASIERLALDKAAALAQISQRKTAEKNRIAGLEREQDRLAAILRERARRARENRDSGGSSGGSGGGGGNLNRGGTLSYPVSAPVTSGFGMRYHPVLHYWRLHAGTDFGAPCGTPVRASASGTVVRAGWSGGYGNQVVIDHGRMKGVGLASSYNHLSRIIKHSGRVSRGQLIGYSGTTGLSTGCHLHFEVYVNGGHVNPMNWL